jgi:MFS family permease
MPDRRLLALQMVFALNALGLAVWFPRIPDVKAALDLDLLTLAFCLFGLPAGTMLGFLVVGRVTLALGLKRTCLIAGPGFLVAMIGPGLAGSAASLFLALFLAGVVVALIEVAMNAKASQMERASGRRLMTRCHAFWSFGTVIGAPLGGAFAEAGWSLLAQQAILQPIFALLTIAAVRHLLPDEAGPAPGQEPAGRGLALPTAALLALCLVPLGALMIEGAMLEWSALFMRQDRAAGPFAAGLALAVFALAMALGRLAGDRLAEAVGPRRVIVASGLLMGAGIAGFALLPAALALPAAALAGFGCANIYPLALSLAAPLPGRRPEQNVATLALIAFTAFLIGPPLIGALGSAFGLAAALAALAPLGLVPLAILGRARRETA